MGVCLAATLLARIVARRCGSDGGRSSTRRDAIAFNIEVEKSHPFGGELVDARRRCPAQQASAIAARLAPAEVVGQYQYDVRQPRSGRISQRASGVILSLAPAGVDP